MSKQSLAGAIRKEIGTLEGLHARLKARRSRHAIEALREGTEALMEVQAEAMRELREVYGWSLSRLGDEFGVTRQGAKFLSEMVTSKKPEGLFHVSVDTNSEHEQDV